MLAVECQCKCCAVDISVADGTQCVRKCTDKGRDESKLHDFLYAYQVIMCACQHNTAQIDVARESHARCQAYHQHRDEQPLRL